jgi:peptidylprolyl isomerase
VIRRGWPTIIAAGAAGIALAACGGGSKTAAIPSSSGAGESSSVPAATATTPKPAAPTPEVKALASAVGTDTKKQPKVPKPKGKPPAKLIADDIVQGKGPGAKAGDQLTVDYVGLNWSNGRVFDASWKTKKPFELALGTGSVIQGWDDGLVGMKAGGRRMLVIPPDLGYGASGRPPLIPASETLIFVIDLRKIG